MSEKEAELIEAAAQKALGGYARPDGVIRDRSSAGAQRLIKEAATGRRVAIRGGEVALLDRRLVGADWLQIPSPSAGIPRIAFVSLKGGVGRSTALAVTASYLSNRGLRVLAVDLDLEAPGIGTMLIEPDALPGFGTLDYLVENGISGIDQNFIDDFVGNSFLGASGGRVSVLPAVGKRTLDNPGAALAKIARAYLEEVRPEGGTISLTDQIREMIDRVTASGDYDVVLVDGRAGLHETTAAVILGLGAEVLLFGVDEPQTFVGYRLLLAHINNYKNEEYKNWQDKIQFVHAKAPSDIDLQEEANSKFYALYSAAYGNIEIEQAKEDLTEDDFDMVWADDSLADDIEIRELKVIRIMDDSRYQRFNPLVDRQSLSSEVFNTTFSSLLRWIDEVVPELQVDIDDD
ncbi:MAG: hypothetical protein V4475_21020 [Pseudomonadota bacterium]